MTPEDQNVAVAQFVGWKEIFTAETLSGRKVSMGFKPGTATSAKFDIPDYVGDLNAVHEAEMMLPEQTPHVWEKTRGNYRWWLCKVIGGEMGMCHSTSAQRSEALLKTIGKWTDS